MVSQEINRRRSKGAFVRFHVETISLKVEKGLLQMGKGVPVYSC
jgi:hypothetical protein